MKYFQLIRVSHWVKNGYVFAPIFFGGAMLQIDKIIAVFIVFILFCFMASAIYIFNDWKDIEADKKHPLKRLRPMATGKVSTRNALTLMVILSVISLLLAFNVNQQLVFVIFSYALLNLAYSLYLKKIAIVDVTVVAMGFLLRVWAGGIVSGVQLSHWLIIMIFLLSMFLAFAKRRDDLIQIYEKGESNMIRNSYSGYSFDFINIALAVISTILLVGYLMYITSDDVMMRLGTQYAYFSFLFVLLGILRYLQMIFVDKNSGNPTSIFWRDPFIQVTIICWISFFTYMLYFS